MKENGREEWGMRIAIVRVFGRYLHAAFGRNFYVSRKRGGWKEWRKGWAIMGGGGGRERGGGKKGRGEGEGESRPEREREEQRGWSERKDRKEEEEGGERTL